MAARNARADLRLFRWLTVLTVALILVVSGIVLVAIRGSRHTTVDFIITLLFSALFSGAATAIVFTSLASRETERQLDISLDNVLRRVFLPLRSLVEIDAVSNYRWATHLMPAPADDPDQTGLQLLRLSYDRSPPRRTISVVCIAAMDAASLEPFADQDRYVMRWQISPHLDPHDPAVFRVDHLRVGGSVVTPTVHCSDDGEGLRLVEWRYRLPSSTATDQTNVDITVTTRKNVTDQTIPLKVVLFANATESEFVCSVDPRIGCTDMSVAGNAHALGPRQQSWSGPTFAGPGSAVEGHARFTSPLQAGSSVTFYIERNG